MKILCVQEPETEYPTEQRDLSPGELRQRAHLVPGMDKIITFHDRSLNFSKLYVKVRKLRQQNFRQKVRNL